ncbi:hypothetical protein HDF16_005901 [Granulicella aggregans]|uniref:Uncharacterized protein n=1 Tax=Granulicella aggregans TaxID=474949 RepID=A0A7W7ZJQ0_9BACT|nr:hypothetical protein [Granulicella aggregans]MBB5061165.1 hypothetical protein [Granulicella aggregans]
MMPAFPICSNEYRVLIVDSMSRAVFVREDRSEYRLIRVCVPTGTRPAQQLQKALRDVWRLPVLVLDVMIPKDGDRPCAIAELLQREAVEGIASIGPDQIPDEELSAQERTWLLSVLSGDSIHPIARIGWADDAVQWVEATTTSKVLSKADIEQFNAGNGFSLLCFRMNDGATHWLKATGAPNTQERSVSLLLTRLCRDYVPEVVAERLEWNAWLMHSSGQSLSKLPQEAPEVERMLQVAVKSLAGLQIRTVGAELDLLNAGAVDHRTHVLRNDAEALFAYIDEAMGCQTSTKVSPLGRNGLASSRIFLNIPATT